MKKMTIIGGTSGIGLYLKNQFKSEYNVIDIGRSENATLRGDLCDTSFCDEILSSCLDSSVVVISAAQILSNHESLDINALKPIYLLENFYRRMARGHIFVLGSQAASAGGRVFEHMDSSSIYYSVAKKMLTEAVLSISSSYENKNVKVTLLEPEYVDTLLGGGNNQVSKSLHLIEPDDIYNSISFILTQPERLNISRISLVNMRK